MTIGVMVRVGIEPTMPEGGAFTAPWDTVVHVRTNKDQVGLEPTNSRVAAGRVSRFATDPQNAVRIPLQGRPI